MLVIGQNSDLVGSILGDLSVKLLGQLYNEEMLDRADWGISTEKSR